MKAPEGNWTNCGGTINEKIKIKISDEETGTECVTKAKKFEKEEENVWNNPWNKMEDLLLNCTKMKIDPLKSRLQGVVIEGADEIKHCIEFLEVVLNDVASTRYTKDAKSNTLNKL